MYTVPVLHLRYGPATFSNTWKLFLPQIFISKQYCYHPKAFQLFLKTDEHLGYTVLEIHSGVNSILKQYLSKSIVTDGKTTRSKVESID